jgi:FkbM family methyltransferase
MNTKRKRIILKINNVKSASDINKNPKLTKLLVKLKSFDKEPIVVVDIGARGGFEDQWSIFERQVKVIGFDPDNDECDRLNQLTHDTDVIYYPYALADKISKRNFYETFFPDSSGFYEPDLNFWHRFPDEINLKVKRRLSVNTIDLDTFVKSRGLKNIDFIKSDVEGAEYDVLKGAKNILNKSILGLSLEVQFFQVHKKQKVFSDVDSLLREHGFILYDMSLYKHVRKALPEVSIQNVGRPSKSGQVLWGQALYFRDPFQKTDFVWNQLKLLKLISLMNLFDQNDSAAEAVSLLHNNKNSYLNMLVPSGYADKSYSEYIKIVKSVKTRGYMTELDHILDSSLKMARLFVPLWARKKMVELYPFKL